MRSPRINKQNFRVKKQNKNLRYGEKKVGHPRPLQSTRAHVTDMSQLGFETAGGHSSEELVEQLFNNDSEHGT